MQGTRANIREAVGDWLGWSPTASNLYVSRANRVIAQAFREVRSNFSELFRGEFRFWSRAHVQPLSSADTISVDFSGTEYDPWVFQRDLSVAELTALSSSYTALETDGTRAGDTLVIRDANGGSHTREIRWCGAVLRGSPATAHEIIVVDKPWHDQDAAGLSWHIETRNYPMPWWMTRITGASHRHYDLKIELMTAEERSERYTRWEEPYPRIAPQGFTVGRRSLDRPRTAPVVTREQTTTWLGPEPPGTWTFKITRVFGFWDERHPYSLPQLHTSPATTLETPDQYTRLTPKYESGPSPVSNAASTDGTNGAIVLSLVDYDHQIGFGDTDRARYHRSGFWHAIYARRTALPDYSSGHPGSDDRPTGYAGTYTQTVNVDVDEDWYLLAYVPAYQYEYVFDGTQNVDRMRRCPTHTSQQVLQLQPVGRELEFEVRGIIGPSEPQDDTTELLVHEDAIDLVTLRAAVLLCPKKEATTRETVEAAYRERVRQVKSDLASTRPSSQPVERIMRDLT